MKVGFTQKALGWEGVVGPDKTSYSSLLCLSKCSQDKLCIRVIIWIVVIVIFYDNSLYKFSYISNI